MIQEATIVFDLDGTLVDTIPDIAAALNDVLTQRGLSGLGIESLRESVAFGAKAMISLAVADKAGTYDIDEMVVEFIDRYETNVAEQSRLYPGAEDALVTLAAAGAKLAVCTNKREHLARKLLKELKIDQYFDAIAGRETLGACKPDPRHAVGVIALAGGDPRSAFLVGDSDIDLMAARAASLPMIAVTFGYGPLTPTYDLPNATIDHFDDLYACLGTLLVSN